MGYGAHIDTVVGHASRLLHLRAAKDNTVAQLEPYLDQTVDELFPVPGPPRDVRITRNLVDRALKASTLSWESQHQVVCDQYLPRHMGPYRKNRTAWARWVRPDGQRRRGCMVYVHGWLEPGSWVEEATLFRIWGKALDVDLLHVSLPFHGRRNPWRALFSGEYFWTADLVRTVEGVRQAICDTRTAIMWLREQGYDEVGVAGISLGGALTMQLACLEPLPDYIVPIVGHLNLIDAVEQALILRRRRRDLTAWGVDEPQRRKLFQRLGMGLHKPLMTPESQLWIQAREDGYIRAEIVRRQWEDWNRPNILWVDGGHMTFPLHIGAMTRRIAEHIQMIRALD